MRTARYRGHIRGKGLMTVFDLGMNATQAARAVRDWHGGPRRPSTAGAVDLCLVVPTYNERDNLPELVERVREAMRGVTWEMIIVDDDSPDGTALLARTIGGRDPRIRVLRRIGRRGPASACLEGMLASHATHVAVMDADLQHDPLLLRAMLEVLRAGSTDLVVASRLLADGPIEDWSAHSELADRVAIRIARMAGPVTLRDPMSGYFAVRREVVDRVAPRLVGTGSKLLLDILFAAPDLRVREMPLSLGWRTRGDSKHSPRMVWDFGLMLAEHRVGAVSGRLLAYLLIAAVALLVHAGTFWLFHELYGLGTGGAQIVAGIALCFVTYGLREWLSYRQSGPWRWYLGLLPFLASRVIGLAAALLIARWMTGLGAGPSAAAFAGAVALVWWNYDAVHRYGGFAR
jgi:dolichol-phosphate mannosyltransferase